MTDGDSATSATKVYAYSKLMASRVLTQIDYLKYLDGKNKAREFHDSLLLSVIDFRNPMIDSEYYDPNYSDMLLFGVIPSNDKGNYKGWGYVR